MRCIFATVCHVARVNPRSDPYVLDTYDNDLLGLTSGVRTLEKACSSDSRFRRKLVVPTPVLDAN